jgi:hypothetical protein
MVPSLAARAHRRYRKSTRRLINCLVRQPRRSRYPLQLISTPALPSGADMLISRLCELDLSTDC